MNLAMNTSSVVGKFLLSLHLKETSGFAFSSRKKKLPVFAYSLFALVLNQVSFLICNEYGPFKKV